jgi:hypothetical protein
MELGRARRWRKICLVVCVLSGLVFGVWVVGTTYSLLSPSYHLENGELAIDIGVLSGSLSIAVGTGIAAWRLGWAIVASAQLESWLPGPRTADEAPLSKLILLVWRGVALAVLFFGVAAFGLGSLVHQDVMAQQLLDTGVRVPARVLAVHDPAKGEPTLDVRYLGGGEFRTARIIRNTFREYRPGQTVTAVYDPSNPARVRTTEEENVAGFLKFLLICTILFGLVGIMTGVVSAARWQGRRRAARTTGWSEATGEVVMHDRTRALMKADLADGSRLVLRPVNSLRSPHHYAGRSGLPVRIGGWERSIIVLFPPEGSGTRPYAVPMIATGPSFGRRRRR